MDVGDARAALLNFLVFNLTKPKRTDKQHKQKKNHKFQIVPQLKKKIQITRRRVRFHIFTSFKRFCFQSVIRVISSASLSLIFIWWLSCVPVSTSITMSRSVNSYEHISMKEQLSFSLQMLQCFHHTTHTLVWDVVFFFVQTYNFDIIFHVLHLVALGHIFQQCHGDLPHLLVISVLQLSTLHKCDRASRKLLIVNSF